MNLQLLFWALIAEIAWTIAWFGSSSIFLPVASQLLSFHNALVLVAIYHIFGNISSFSLFWRHWNKRIFWLFGIPSIIATVIGASLASQANPDLLKLILGIVLIIFAGYSLLKPSFRFKASSLIWRIWGIASWFTAGLIGTGWVLRGAFLTSFGLTKEAYIATIASIALLVDITRVPVYFANGLMDTSLLWTIPVLFVIAYTGSWIGKKIVQRINENILRKIILWAIIIVSGLLAWQWLSWLTTTKVWWSFSQTLESEYIIPWAEKIELLRQSWVECSSYSAYAASKVFWIDVWTREQIRESLRLKFSFGILPYSFERYLNKHFSVYRIERTDSIKAMKELLRFVVHSWEVVILLVEHQGYQHYFTILWYDTPQDKRYIYDSLAPRLDNTSYTQDLNWDEPWNYTIDSQTLYDKRSRWWKHGLWERWWVGLSTKES